MKLWTNLLRAKWFQGDDRKSKAKAWFLPRLEELERREAPVSLFNPLFASAFLSLDPLAAPYSIVPGDGSNSGSSDQGDGGGDGSSGGDGSQGGDGGGSGASQPPPDNFVAADPAAAASTVNLNAGLFDSVLGGDDASFAAIVSAAVGGQGQSAGTPGVGAAVVIGLPGPSTPPTSPAVPQDAASGPAPALAPTPGTAPTVGVGLSPSEFNLNPFPLLSGPTIAPLTPFVVGAAMTVPAAHPGGGTTVTTGTDANSIGFTTTTTDSFAFNATLTPDAAGGLTYEETYSFTYDVQTVPAATGGASVHDWGASGYTFIANNDGGNYSFTLTAALTADETGSVTQTSTAAGSTSTATTTWKSETQYDRTLTDTTNPATGAATGSDSGGGVATQSSSTTGTYSRPITVGFGSGTVSGSTSSYSGQGVSYQFATQEGLTATGVATQSGTWNDASGGYSGDWYSGSGSYAASGTGAASTPATADATPVPSVSGGPYAPGATLTGGGVYTESGADSMGYGSSDQYSLQNDGSWQASSGAGSSSGTGWTQNSWSGSGGYGYGIAGGSVSGTWQQSGGAETNYNTTSNSTLNSSGWTQTGTYASGDGGGQYNSYQGSGNYAINSTAASASGSGSGSGSGSATVAPPPAVDASPVPSASGGPYAPGATFTGTGLVSETESDSSGYADNSTSTLASGSWQPSSGSGWTGASGATQWGYSASGVYGYAIAGGSVSGTWQQSGSASTNSNTTTNSTLGSNGAWTTTGAADSSDGGGESDSYQGSGNYAIDAPAASTPTVPAVDPSPLPSASGGPGAAGAAFSGAGVVAEQGANDSGYADSGASTLASGSWQPTAGAHSTSASGSTQWGYSASGAYGYLIAGGSVSGTWQQSGSANTNSSTVTNATLGSNGAWTTTGAAVNAESGGQDIGYSGSGNYAVASGVGAAAMSGSGAVAESGTDDWGYGYAMQSTIGASGQWLPATGSGATTETDATQWGYSASGDYTRPLDGGVLSGTWQAVGGADAGYQVQTVSTLNPDGSWTTTGAASSSGSGSGLWAYSGAGSFTQSSSSGNSASGSDSSFSSQATENYSQGWSSQYTVLSLLAATGLVATVTTASASGSASGSHSYSSSGAASSWTQTGNYAAGNGTSSGTNASSGTSLTESMQSQWQEGYVITSGPTGTTTTGGASGSSQASGNSSSYSDSSGFAESASSSSGFSNASGTGWWSNVAGQDHYSDQSSWAEPWNLVGMSSSGATTVDHVWGNETNAWGSSGWSSSAGSGSGSGSSTSSSGSLSSSYNQDVGYSGFSTANGGSSGLAAPGADPGWSWGVGWYGAGVNGPLGPSAYSGLGYVFPPGDPVSVAPVNDQSNAEGQAVSLQVQASDASAGAGNGGGGGSGTGYSETGLPLGLNINSNTGLITGTIAAGDFMDGPLDVVTVTYTDTAGHSANQSFLWFISDPVTVTNPGDQSGTEGVPVDLTPQATDANGGALVTWSETGLPAGLNIDPDGGAVTGTPDAGSAGVYVVTLTATDPSGASASQTLVWTVAPAVTITDPGVQSATEGAAVNLQIQAKDATGGTLAFSETGLPLGLSISSSGAITGTISAGDATTGVYVATITATDGTYSASQTVVWTVSPAVSITDPGPQSSTEGDPVSLQIQATDSTGGTLTYSETGLPASLSISSSGQITGTVTTAGFYDATITATDGTYSGATTIGWDVAASAVAMTDPGAQTNTQGDSRIAANPGDGRGRLAARLQRRRPARRPQHQQHRLNHRHDPRRRRRLLLRHGHGLRRRRLQRQPDLRMVRGPGRDHHRPRPAIQHGRRRGIAANSNDGRPRDAHVHRGKPTRRPQHQQQRPDHRHDLGRRRRQGAVSGHDHRHGWGLQRQPDVRLVRRPGGDDHRPRPAIQPGRRCRIAANPGHGLHRRHADVQRRQPALRPPDQQRRQDHGHGVCRRRRQGAV